MKTWTNQNKTRYVSTNKTSDYVKLRLSLKEIPLPKINKSTTGETK